MVVDAHLLAGSTLMRRQVVVDAHLLAGSTLMRRQVVVDALDVNKRQLFFAFLTRVVVQLKRQRFSRISRKCNCI